MAIMVYGRFDTQYSHAQVSRGLVKGLVRHGLPVQIFNVWGASRLAVDPDAPIYEDLQEVSTKIAVGHQANAPIGFFVGGYPPQIGSWLDGHNLRIALLITESSRVPQDWACIANEKLDVVLVPSCWARRAYLDAGVKKPIHVVHHGLHRVYETPPATGHHRVRVPYRFGHVAGAASFLHRKGTPQLVRAFRQAFEPGEAVLQIYTPQTPAAWKLVDNGFITVEWSDAPWQKSPEAMRRWYREQDYLVQPSRAEAFGLCPVEARACGVPVILTDCAGHKDHVEVADQTIATGQDTPITVNGIPDGLAPALDVTDLIRALKLAKRAIVDKQIEAHKLACSGYAKRWSWSAVTAKLARSLKTALDNSGAKTLDSKLGF